MSGFKDHFSGHADRYEAYRPHYPDGLFEYLASIVPGHDLAWDFATGNGQAAFALAPFFDSVLATDASERQIDQARPQDKIRYVVARAELCPASDRSVDLVTVAQALHWFDLSRFFGEVERVAKPGGILAVWCYELHSIDPEVDAVVHRLYHEIVGAYWPPERRLVEEGYRTLRFPFEEIKSPSFQMTEPWNLAHLLGYLGTWSSVQKYRAQNSADPVVLIRADLEAAWGDPELVREVVWPLHLRVGRVHETTVN